jgi:hypothetical protein
MAKHFLHDKDECYLCGAPATTCDHIPPLGLFPKPRPTNLITVPACRTCNHGKSLDDEYFRNVVAASSDDSPQSLNLLHQRIIPRFRKKPGLILELLKSIEWVDELSPGGIYLGRRRALGFDRNRIQAVIDKLVRGLFFNHAKRRLATNYVVDEFLYNPPIKDPLMDALVQIPLVKIGDGSVFNYRYHLPDSLGYESYWFLMFYNDKSLFITKTLPAAGTSP